MDDIVSLNDTNMPTLICSNYLRMLKLYLKDTNTLGDGVCLLHEVGDPGHDGGAVVAGPLPHLAQVETLASVAGSDESGVEAVGHVTPVCSKCLQSRKWT